MTQACCFNCGYVMKLCNKPLEELIKEGLPIFCSADCADEMPDNGTPEFKDKVELLKRRFKIK